MDTHNLNLSQERLRKLADRVPTIVERHGDASPVIGALGSMTVPLAAAYVEMHDAVRALHVTTRAALATGHARVTALHAQERVWLAVIVRDLPGFDRSQVVAEPDAPEAVFADGEHMLDVVRDSGAALPYAAALLATLGAELEAARAAWAAAQEALATLQSLQSTLRARGAAFGSAMVGLRRALRAHLGSTHRDFRLLRVTRLRTGVEDDDAGSDAAVATVTASSSGGGNGLATGNRASTPVLHAKAQ